MKRLTIGSAILTGMGLALIALALSERPAGAQSAAQHSLTTPAEYERWQKELSNWGRWGKDDELGTLNLVTPAKRKQAAALVKEGFSVSLARNASATKEIDNPCPIEWAMTTDTPGMVMDRIGYPCIHGSGTTHLDSFAHVFFNGRMWNGDSKTLVTKEGGAAKNSILTMKNGIVTRGVLYDVPSRAVLRKDPFRRSVLITTKHRRDFGDFRQEPRSYTIHLVSLDIAKAR